MDQPGENEPEPDDTESKTKPPLTVDAEGGTSSTVAETVPPAASDGATEPELPLVTPAFDPLTEPELPLQPELADAVESAETANAEIEAEGTEAVAEAAADEEAAESEVEATVEPQEEPALQAQSPMGTEAIEATVETEPGQPEEATHDTVETGPKPALPMQKPAPSWAQTDPAAEKAATEETGEDETEPKPAVAMQKPAPSWAQTAPAPAEASGEPEPTPPAQPVKSAPLTWPPKGQPDAELPTQSDIWPPEPPTEHTMPAWPPAAFGDAGGQLPNLPTEPAKSDWTPAPAKTVPPVTATPPTVPPEKTIPPATVPPAAGPPAKTVQPAAMAPDSAPAMPTLPVVAAPHVQEPEPEPAKSAAPDWTPGAAAPASAASPADDTQWPSVVDVPAWAPQIHISTRRPEAPAPAPEPAAPPAPAPAPAAPAPAAPAPAPAAAQPAAAVPGAPSSSSWQVVEQKHFDINIRRVVPTPEDRSYAEWFTWAKRGGAPVSACHAAAQAAFHALSTGKDVSVAAQMAAAAMANPPLPVDAGRQTYCAWFALANIDLSFDQPHAHAFATGAVHALDAGADARGAHAAGLEAAGVK